MEKWKIIKGYDGKYNISSYGRVWSNVKNRMLSLSKEKYHRVVLMDGIKIRHLFVHLLVWDHFGNELRTKQVDHIDENKYNNKIENLQLLTNQENVSKHNLLRTDTTSKFIGVHWHKKNKKWVAMEKHKHIGCYENEYEAHLAYQNQLK